MKRATTRKSRDSSGLANALQWREWADAHCVSNFVTEISSIA
jgi:hypothetical protein